MSALAYLTGGFTSVIGNPVPFVLPNVRPGRESEDLDKIVNEGIDPRADRPNAAAAGGGGDKDADNSASLVNESNQCMTLSSLATCLCCSTLLGGCWLLCTQQLIRSGQYGFSELNGKYYIHFAGRLWMIPLQNYLGARDIGEDLIQIGPISIIRIQQGQLGLAMNNSLPEILLPGTHVRTNTTFRFTRSISIDEELVEHGPIKLLTVKSATVRVAYNAGKVEILSEGRYAINSGVFKVANAINTQQQNLKFREHPVLLDGGIGLLVEGLLTFKVIDVEKLIKELGERDLMRCIEDVTKAELSRVFAAIHLEQISSATSNVKKITGKSTTAKMAVALLGAVNEEAKSNPPAAQPRIISYNTTAGGLPELPPLPEVETQEAEERSKICENIIQFVRPLVEPWGIKIVNFQLESTKIADRHYAQEYEQASLSMAKAKANLRAVDSENEILIRQAQAKAKSVRIEAEGKKNSLILIAKGEAEARVVEANSRNEAATAMKDDFAREYAMIGQQVAFAGKLKATSLTVLPDSMIGGPIAAQPLLAAQRRQ